jgi:hypothetical protein
VAVYSAGSETERVALKKRSETQNRSTIQIFTTKHVSAPAQCHARHPRTPPNTPRSCRTDQGPNRDAAAAAGPEQTGLADRAPAAGSAAAAGSPQAARWQVRVAVSDPNCSRPAPGRPSGSGSAGAMSRVGGALREQRGGGCVRLGERCASRAACLSCGLCAQLTWPSRYLCTMRAGELGRRTILAGWRAGFCTPPKWSGAPVRPAAWCAGRGRSILGTVSLHHSIVWPCGLPTR